MPFATSSKCCQVVQYFNYSKSVATGGSQWRSRGEQLVGPGRLPCSPQFRSMAKKPGGGAPQRVKVAAIDPKPVYLKMSCGYSGFLFIVVAVCF